MNRQLYVAALAVLVFLFVESALSTPLKQYREINFNPYKRHKIIKTSKTCNCDSEDIDLPEITFHTVDPSNDKFIQRILYHSQIEDLRDSLTSTGWSGLQRTNVNEKLPDRDSRFRKIYFEEDDNEERLAALDPRLRQQAEESDDNQNENSDANDDDERLAALDPRLRQQAEESDDNQNENSDANDDDERLAALDPRLRQQAEESDDNQNENSDANDDDERLAALDPRLRQQAEESDDNQNENSDANDDDERLAALDSRLSQQPDNSNPTPTNNENPQQEAPLDQSEIPIPNMTLEEFRAMIDARSNDPNSVLSQGKFPNTKAVWLANVEAGKDPRSPLDDPSTE